MKSTGSVVIYLISEFLIPACYTYIRLHSAHCMKISCYFLLNIKHRASQVYWGRPPNTTMRPPGGERGGGYVRG